MKFHSDGPQRSKNQSFRSCHRRQRHEHKPYRLQKLERLTWKYPATHTPSAKRTHAKRNSPALKQTSSAPAKSSNLYRLGVGGGCDVRGDCDGDLFLAGRGDREETLLATPARAAAPDAPCAAGGLGFGCRRCCCCCTCPALPLLPSARLPQVRAPETSALRLPPPTDRTVPGVIGRPRAAVAVLGALGLFRPAAVEGPVGQLGYEGGAADEGGVKVYAAEEDGESSQGVKEFGGDPINEEGERKFDDGEGIPRAVESRIPHPLLLPPLPLPRRLSCCFMCSSSWVSCASVLNRANPPPTPLLPPPQ